MEALTILQWLDQSGERPAELARRAGLSVATIWRLRHGFTTPTRTTQERLRAATDGRLRVYIAPERRRARA